MKQLIVALAMLSAGAAGNLQADGQATTHGQTMDHSAMARTGSPGAASGQGTINSVDSAGRSVNIAHGPIPALDWPAMTMDLPVTEQVDLSGVKPGDKIDFRILLDSDGVYRITALARAR